MCGDFADGRDIQKGATNIDTVWGCLWFLYYFKYLKPNVRFRATVKNCFTLSVGHGSVGFGFQPSIERLPADPQKPGRNALISFGTS